MNFLFAVLEPPPVKNQIKLLKELYRESNIDPQTVTYIETSGCSVGGGEAQEVQAIYDVFCNDRSSPLLIGSVASNDVFCNDRSSPLLIGSVASNIGHTETASGWYSKDLVNERPALVA